VSLLETSLEGHVALPQLNDLRRRHIVSLPQVSELGSTLDEKVNQAPAGMLNRPRQNLRHAVSSPMEHGDGVRLR